jgi:hypothetical protein
MSENVNARTSKHALWLLQAYKLLGNYARGEELYSLEEREEDPSRFHQYIVYNPSKVNTLVASHAIGQSRRIF